MKNILIGVAFAMLWASASVPTKIGIQIASPLLIATTRFFIAGPLMLLFVKLFLKDRFLPTRSELVQLFWFSLFNTTIYLGAFVICMREVSAGIGSLSTATGPLFVVILSAFWLNRTLKSAEIIGVVLGLAGAFLATWPLLQNNTTTLWGLVILMLAIVSISGASVYYASIDWQLSRLVINGWQVTLAGITLLPFTVYFADFEHSQFNLTFWACVGWLIGPVSILGLQLWFYLLRQDALKASLWLFLCPIFGFIYANFILNEPLSWHTFAGTALVVAGLYVAQIEKFRKIV
jgi:probable blue pigment (indigoidine) exporter